MPGTDMAAGPEASLVSRLLHESALNPSSYGSAPCARRLVPKAPLATWSQLASEPALPSVSANIWGGRGEAGLLLCHVVIHRATPIISTWRKLTCVRHGQSQNDSVLDHAIF